MEQSEKRRNDDFVSCGDALKQGGVYRFKIGFGDCSLVKFLSRQPREDKLKMRGAFLFWTKEARFWN